jgi:hypothetical protein
MWKNIIRNLVLFTTLSIAAVAQPTAAFSFLEDNTLVVIQAGEKKVVDIATANGPTQFEVGLIQVNRNTPGVIEHWQLFGRNLGGIGQLGEPDGAVHPLAVVIQFENTGITTSRNQIFDRNNQLQAHVRVAPQNRIYGLRDAWMQEPTRLQTLPDNGGTIRFFCLDNRAPPNGYPHYYAQYKTSFGGFPGEDPLSATNHRWKGGFMKLWDIIITDNASWDLIELDPMPTNVPDEWYIKTRHAFPQAREPYPPRVQKILESLDKLNLAPTPASPFLLTPKDPTGGHTLLWWIFQAENRFRYWNAQDLYILNMGNKSHQVGWKDWLCLKWQEGHYNNGFNWGSILFRRWLDTRSPIAWWIFTRVAKWEGTSGLVWSGQWDHGTQAFTPYSRWGSDWYEKGTRGWEVGSNYWPSSYKNYSEQILLANLVYDQWWSRAAEAAHGIYIRHNTGYENWTGMYGSRIAGWGMMNAMAFYRFTGDSQWITYARSIADNAINIMKEPARLNFESNWHGQQWANNELGVPYIYNLGAPGKREFSSWSTAKLCVGLIEISIYSGTTDYHSKIKQIAEFLVEECTIDFGDFILHRPQMSADRITAQYYNGHPAGRIGYVSGTTTGDWLIWPVGYAATFLNSTSCAAVFPRMAAQVGELLDWGPSISHHKYEIGSGDRIGNFVTINNIDLTGPTTKHNLRLEDGNGEYALFHIRQIIGTTLEIQQFWSSNNSTFGNNSYITTVVGPFGENRPNPGYYARTTVDRAIRNITINTSSRPNPNRPFDWSNGRHFNNWPKMVAIPLTQGSLPFQALRIFLHNQQAAGLLGIGGKK